MRSIAVRLWTLDSLGCHRRVKSLRQAREGRGWKLAETSAVTGISFGHLAKAERGDVSLSADHRIRLIRALELTPDEVREIAELSPLLGWVSA